MLKPHDSLLVAFYASNFVYFLHAAFSMTVLFSDAILFLSLFSDTRCTDEVDLILNVDLSGSVSSFLPQMRTFLADFLAQYTIAPSNTQVAMVTFNDPAVVNWNWQSAQTSSYDVLVQNINTAMAGTGSIGTVNGGFLRAYADVIGSQFDRPDAENVIITIGDGGESPSLPSLDDISEQAR